MLLQAKLRSFTAAARLQLRTCLANHAHLPLLAVTIEGIKSDQHNRRFTQNMQPDTCSSQCNSQGSGSKQARNEASQPKNSWTHSFAAKPIPVGVTIAVHIQLGSQEAQGEQLVAALQAAPETVLQNSKLLAAVGITDKDSLYAEVINVTPGLPNKHALPEEPIGSLQQQPQTSTHTPTNQLIEVSCQCSAD